MAVAGRINGFDFRVERVVKVRGWGVSDRGRVEEWVERPYPVLKSRRICSPGENSNSGNKRPVDQR